MLKINSNTPHTDKDATAYVEQRLGWPVGDLNRFPRFFEIETVNSCNARCIMCGIDFDSRPKSNMDDALFAKITDEISNYTDYVEKVMLYLDGEPLIDKKLPHRIKMMKDAGVKKVSISSNGSLLNEKNSVAIIEAGLDDIYLTIDSLKKETYEAIRVRLDFDEVYNNVINFISLRNKLNPQLMIRVQMILQELNQNERDDFIPHFEKLLSPTDQIVVQKAHNWGSTLDVMKFGDEDKVNNYPCIALWGTFVVHVNGDVPLCCIDTDTKYPLGNLNEQTIEEVWTGEPMRAFREKHLNGMRSEISICDGCTLWREDKHFDEILDV